MQEGGCAKLHVSTSTYTPGLEVRSTGFAASMMYKESMMHGSCQPGIRHIMQVCMQRCRMRMLLRMLLLFSSFALFICI